jgi:glycyl-tRNA synthetase beta subunit
VDQFFADVLVMADDDDVRLRRLSLLKRLERLISRLADVSELVREQD